MRCFWCKKFSSSSEKVINPRNHTWLSVPLFVFHKLFHKVRIVQDWGSLERTGKGINLTRTLGSDHAGLRLKRFSCFKPDPKSPPKAWVRNLRVFSAVSLGDQFNFFFFFFLPRCQSSKKNQRLSFPNTNREAKCVMSAPSKPMALIRFFPAMLRFVWPNLKEQILQNIDLPIRAFLKGDWGNNRPQLQTVNETFF